ncbi:hypothetical protein TNCV_1291911 [Trichonephila clavipes]|nr:hypothetical protein TNCV_1291911 [Trichonephila clavipes]
MEASDDGACVRAVFAAALTMQLHFACRQSGTGMERCTNAELADRHKVPPIAMDELHSGSTLNVTVKGKLPTCSQRRVSDSRFFILGAQVRERRITPNNEETAASGTEQSHYIPVCRLSPVMSGFPI